MSDSVIVWCSSVLLNSIAADCTCPYYSWFFFLVCIKLFIKEKKKKREGKERTTNTSRFEPFGGYGNFNGLFKSTSIKCAKC